MSPIPFAYTRLSDELNEPFLKVSVLVFNKNSFGSEKVRNVVLQS